jgi:ribosome-associated protein YbcJ (S4-like RNA binding protein)
MKRRELKEMIKAAYLSEADFTNAQDDDAALGGMYDPVYEGEDDLDQMLARISEEDLYEEDLDEMIANLDEADEEESIEDILTRITGTAVDPYLAEAEGDEEEDIEVDAEEETTDGGEEKNDSIVVDKKIVSLSSLPQETRKILDTLETLRAQAEEFGDQKFITQVGNTITFFTRDFVVAGDEPTRAKVDESLEILRMKKLAGLLTEGEYAKALLRENQTNFPSEDEIKRKGAVGDSVTVSKDGKNYDINYTISSESDDEMSFGIYDSEEGEDAEQIEEFYTYKELINWFNN